MRLRIGWAARAFTYTAGSHGAATPSMRRGRIVSVHQLQERPVEASADGALVQLHLNGHGDAFAALYREYFSRLVRLCRARTGDLATAEDLAQEALLRALNHMDRFQVDRPMWPWLKTIAIRLSIDYSRQRRPEPCEDPCEGRSVSDDTGWLEEGPILEEALAGLPARQRVALKLRYLDDWTPAEAAAALGLTRPAFDQLLFRARGKLRTEYRRVCGDTPARVHVMVWPLLAIASRIRHGVWRAKLAAQTAVIPAQVAADSMAAMVVAVTIAAAAVGASLGQASATTPLTDLHTIVAQSETDAMATQAGFAAVAPAVTAASTASTHDSFTLIPAANDTAADYPDLAVRLANLQGVTDTVAPEVPAEAPAAAVPNAAAGAEAPEAPAAPNADAAPVIDVPNLVNAPAASLPKLPPVDLDETLGL